MNRHFIINYTIHSLGPYIMFFLKASQTYGSAIYTKYTSREHLELFGVGLMIY